MGLDIQSKEVIDKISDELKVQPALQIPRELMDKIQLVYNVNPVRNAISDGGTRAVSGTQILYTTPTDRDFFLTSANMQMIKDVVCDSATGAYALIVFINGLSIPITNLPIITLTAQSAETYLSFPVPLKLDRGTTISVTGVFTAGVCVRSGTIQGFLTDPQ